jgi:putative isomerase
VTKLAEHIESIKEHITRPPSGLLPYRFIVPTARTASVGEADRQAGVYEQQYDWDAFFEGVALAYDGGDRAEAFRDAMRNFLHFTSASGFTPRTLSPEKFWDFPDQMKPFLAQGCLVASRALGDFDWLEGDYFARIESNLTYWETNRIGGHGLFMWRSALESGVDNNAASVNTPDLSIESVDVNAYLVREYRAAALIAERLGNSRIGTTYRARAHELRRRMEAVLWDERDACYYNVYSSSDTPIDYIRVKSWTCLTPLWAEVPTRERARRLVETHVLDESTFWGSFGIPSLARSEPLYGQAKRALIFIAVENRRWEVSNWQGPVWVVANWQVMHGLLRYGFAADAVELARRLIRTLAADVESTGGMHENYDAETGVGLWSPNFGSWNLLAARMIEEAETGFDPTHLDDSDFAPRV